MFGALKLTNTPVSVDLDTGCNSSLGKLLPSHALGRILSMLLESHQTDISNPFMDKIIVRLFPKSLTNSFDCLQ